MSGGFMTRRVVVTGLGLVTPLGNTVESSWGGITAGRSGVGPLTYFDTSNFNVKIAAQLKDFNPAEVLPANELRRYDPYQVYIVSAAREVIDKSGFSVGDEPHRASVLIGSATGGTHSFEEYHTIFMETKNPRKMTPFAIPMLVANGGSNIVSIMTGANGPSCVPVSACATGADCIGMAFDLIRAGRLDRALAGAGEYPILDLGIAAFDRIGACSRHNEEPEKAMRPFDKNRNGIVFGEGAGVMLLETLESAQARGAEIIAELVGYSSTTDGFHRTAPDPQGRGAVQAMSLALQDAHINPEDIGYINAHGTATSLNDSMETLAIKSVFGDHAYKLAVSSTKSMTGHAMGATAAMEAIFAVLALRDQLVPPTINYETPDPECDLDYVPNESREWSFDYALSNAFGFGGHNACLVFKRFND